MRHVTAIAPLLILTVAPALAQGVRQASFTGAATPREAALLRGDDDSVSGRWGVDLPTAYFYRGIQIENQGVIAQPYTEFTYALHEGEQTVRSVDLVFGTWNSLHEGPTGTGGGQSAWYEADFYAGLAIGIGARFSASGTYSYYASPNGVSALSEEAIFSVAFDDTDLLGEGFAGLQPNLTFGFETKGQTDGGNDRGTYAQIAIEPSLGLGKAGDFDFTLAVPIAVGFSLGDYYEDANGKDRAFGFLDIGAVVTTPLPFVPTRFGPWTLSLSVHALFLGSTCEALNGGDDFEVIGAVGLSTIF